MPSDPAASSAPDRRWVRPALTGHPWLRRLVIAVSGLALLVVALDLIVPPVAKRLANRRLAALPDYTGRVGSVTCSLWRGRAEIGDFTFRERGHDENPPLLQVRRVVVNLAYTALVRGELGGAILVEHADATLINRPGPAAGKPAKAGPPPARKIARWQDALRQAFPFRLSRFEAQDGRVRFLDRTTQPNVDVGIAQLHVVVSDLGNRPADPKDPLPTKILVTGVTTGNGGLTLSAEANPVARHPRFSVKLELKDLSLPPFNSFLLAHADADVSRGTFELYLEAEAAEGAYHGYVKPFFKNLDFQTASDEHKSAGQLLVKKIVSGVASLLKNDEDQKVATKVPFSGNFSQNDVDVWTAIANLLRNAFVQALREGLEGSASSH